MPTDLVLQTERLNLRRMSLEDSDFVIELLNEPSFVRFIGDKRVRNRADAGRYLREGPLESYARHGFGLYLVEAQQTGSPLGMCGLLKRETLADVDVGFAFLPRYWSQGYAFESAAAVLADGRTRCGLTRIVAITSPDNVASIQLLERLGFQADGRVRLSADTSEVCLFASEQAPLPGLGELFAELERMPEEFERALGQIPTERLGWKPDSWEGSPGETFSALEHACHVRDIEIDGYQVRIQRLLQEPEPELVSLDGYALAEERRYSETDPQAAVASFRAARRATLARVRGLGQAELTRTGVFAEYGRLSLRALLHYLRSHDQQHLACLHWLMGRMASA